MAATPALREALNNGISSGNFVDTKIILYSHKDSSGRICQPKPLYTNSHVLRTVPYFTDLLFGNFSESQSKNFGETIDQGDYAEDYGYSSDSDLETDEDEAAWIGNTADARVQQRSGNVVAGRNKTIRKRLGEDIMMGKVVKVTDMAFVTFQAFLMYLYSGVIEFAPFGSGQNRKTRAAEIVDPSDDKVPRPSPKSIYRLADKYDVPTLKTFALNRIRSELGKCDIVEESFSKFASRYDEIRSLYIGQLAFVWMDHSKMETTRGVKEKIDSFVKGDLEHALGTVSALWEVANTDGDVQNPSKTAPVATNIRSPAHWASVKVALINSIRKGIFFNTTYLARHTKAGNEFKPIHFSSIIMNDKLQELKKLVTPLEARNPLISDPEEDPSIDSDCEGDLMEAEEETLKWKDGEQTCATLTVGSFSTWKSLFFYRCTDEISFAPLRSQGVNFRLKYIRENTVTTAPPPCSPKGIYVLANSLGITTLSNSAFTDIKCKLSLNNAVDEVLSRTTASQEKIMKMQCELLVSSWRDPKTIAQMKENLERISHGSSPHTGGALNFGLEKAFEVKRRKAGRR